MPASRLMVAPQMAAYHIQEALLSLDSTQVADAIQTGFHEIFDALVQFPQSVIGDIIGALNDTAQSAVADVPGDILAVA